MNPSNSSTAGSPDGARHAGGCPFAGAFTGGGRRSGVDPAAAGGPAADRRSTREPNDAPEGIALARHVTEQVRHRGRHFLPDSLLARLAEVRRTGHAPDPYLDAFLDCVLDKHDGRFHNRTYLALPLLEQLIADPRCGLDPDRMSALLIADVIRFESASAGTPQHHLDDPPDPRTLRTRLAHARRFVAACRNRAGTEDPDLPAPPAGAAGEWFALTVQPVYVLHDEYFFIRALQCHEMLFTVLAADLHAATRALREGSVETVAARLRHANAMFARAALLFRMVATMRVSTFHAFREFTQGASAIQSEQYKRFEIACGMPSAQRLASEAFTNVPRVATDAVAGSDDLSRAYLDTRREGDLGPTDWAVVDAGIAALESSHQRWKTTHHSLAARMLGDASGSGYTAGVPYLRRGLALRLFWRLGEEYPGGPRAA